MASPNRLVVEVVGDTTKLTQSLTSAQQQINRFAGKSKIHTTALDDTLTKNGALKKEFSDLAEKEAAVQRRTDLMNGSIARTGASALLAGFAVNALGRNMQELGGNTAKFGSALSDLTSGNLVGFVRGLQSVNSADPKGIAEGLLAAGDAAKANALANAFAAAGFNDVATAARGAAAAIRSANDAFVDNNKIRDSTSPGSIAAETSGVPLPDPKKGRKGLTQNQRNAFFDNDIARLLDRSQDGSLPDQVTKLRQIEQVLKERQAAQKDVTRRLTLGDEIVAVRRQRITVEGQIADDAKRRAEDAKRAAEELKREREAREKALEEARRVALQARQFRALGFAADGSDVVPGAENLRKQLSSLTERLGSSSVNLSSKLENQLEGVRKVLAGKFGQVTRESRDRIQELFATIRGEFDKQGKGPLTKTSGLDTKKILAGLGLSPADEAELRSRLSNVNSAGRVNAVGGTANGQLVESHITVNLDGKQVASAVTRSQQKTKLRNPPQRRGPNRGKF